MKLKNLFMLLGLMAIPAWYAYRTATDKTIGRLDFNKFLPEDWRSEKSAPEAGKTAEGPADLERKQLEEKRLKEDLDRQKAEVDAARVREAEVKTEGQRYLAGSVGKCVAAVQSAEGSYRAYVEERFQYRTLTDALLRSTIQSTDVLSADSFQSAFRHIYVPVPGDTEQHADLERAANRCFDLARSGQVGVDSSEEARVAAEKEAFFSRCRGLLNDRRSKIERLVKYWKGQFASTLQGEIERSQIREEVDQWIRYRL
jgi:hypothetical protein